MRCEFGACNITDPMFVYTCNGKSTWFLFDRLLRYDGSISGRTRIRVAESNNLCLQIDENYDAILRPCNVTDASQLFHQGDGDLDGEKFALQTPNGCLAQDHHPKGGEQIFIQDCYATEYSRTKYWTKY